MNRRQVLSSERIPRPEQPTDDEREALARELHERFAPEHVDHWNHLDEQEQRDSEWWDVAGVVLASDVWRNRRQGPITDAQVEAATTRASAWFSEEPWWLRNMVIAALEAARDAS